MLPSLKKLSNLHAKELTSYLTLLGILMIENSWNLTAWDKAIHIQPKLVASNPTIPWLLYLGQKYKVSINSSGRYYHRILQSNWTRG